MIATITVLNDISTAPMAGERSTSYPYALRRPAGWQRRCDLCAFHGLHAARNHWMNRDLYVGRYPFLPCCALHSKLEFLYNSFLFLRCFESLRRALRRRRFNPTRAKTISRTTPLTIVSVWASIHTSCCCPLLRIGINIGTCLWYSRYSSPNFSTI